MKDQAIKTKSTAAKVARSIKKDVEDAINFLEGYNIELIGEDYNYQVAITSSTYSTMLTNVVLKYLFQIADVYMFQYEKVDYGVLLRDNKPAFVYSIGWNIK